MSNYRIIEQQLTSARNHLIRSGSQYVILLPFSGACLVRVHGKEYACLSSDLVLMKPGETLSLQTMLSAEDFAYRCIRISTEYLVSLSDETFSFPDAFAFAPYPVSIVHGETKVCSLLRNLMMRISDSESEEAGVEEVGRELYIRSLFTLFLIQFIRACIRSDQVHIQNQKRELIIDDVFLYIGRHLAEDLSLTSLSREFFVSEEHLSRKFKKSTGMGLHAYITRARLDQSVSYLLQGEPVNEVYAKCGFQSYNSFFRVFRKEFHMSPQQYVRQALQRTL